MPKKEVSAREIMQAHEFIVDLPNLGWPIKCRKVGNLDLILKGARGLLTFFEKVDEDGGKPDEPLTDEKKLELARREYEASRQLALASAISPKVSDEPWDEIDRDEAIHVSVLDPDILYLAMRILHESNLIPEMPDLPFFRGPLAAADTQGGDDLRGTTERTIEAAGSGAGNKSACVRKPADARRKGGTRKAKK